MIVTLALSPSLDVTYEVDRLRRGAITRPSAVTRVAGGKALNVARVAHALGADVHSVVALGGHIGAWVGELLAADGVPATVVRLGRETRTCAAIVEVGDHVSSTDLYEPATPLTPAEWSAFREAVTRVAGGQRPWVAVSGSLPEGVEPADVAALLGELRDAGARVAVDSSGAGLRAMGPLADLVKVNRAEAEEVLASVPVDAAAAARALHTRWGCDAVVTDGVAGSFALLRGDEVALPPTIELGRFSAGSGDAFLGGLLTALDEGRDAASALTSATAAAERNARVPGQGVLG